METGLGIGLNLRSFVDRLGLGMGIGMGIGLRKKEDRVRVIG